ncbi:MAG: M28 family peptidase [bacterium]
MKLPADAAQMMAWISAIVAQGIRRPGYPADRWVETWAAEQFRALGLADVRLEPLELPYWEPHRAELVVGGESYQGFPLPHAAAGDVEAELRLEADGPGGCLSVSELELLRIPQSGFRLLATSTYDPDGDFDTLEQVLPFGVRFREVMDPAIAAGALGFVGLLTGFPWETRDYYVPYDAVARPIPGLWLSNADGRRLLGRLAGGAQRGRLTVEVDRHPVTTHNVVGVLPGASDEWVIVASHHDAPWASAVEDASGIALVLAQAAHWAAVPRQARPHNMLFLLTAGHMAEAAGTRAFIARHAALVERTVLQVHLEHAARRCVAQDGALTATDEPEVRWWFTSRIASLQAAVAAALSMHDLRRSLVLPPTVFGPMPTTDGAYFHPAGVPLVHFLTAPMYLFDSCDTVDKIHVPSLEPVTRAVVDIIASTHGHSAAAMRAAVTS